MTYIRSIYFIGDGKQECVFVLRDLRNGTYTFQFMRNILVTKLISCTQVNLFP